MNIKKLSLHIVWLLGVLICLSQATSLKTEQFETRKICSGLIENETKIDYYVDGQKIGIISYTKVPLLPFYAVHSFYIDPAHRNKGHGKKLLTYTCNHLQSIGAKRIYIQPGPFEMVDGKAQNIHDASRAVKIEQLVALYKKCGFNQVNKCISLGAGLLYKSLNIDEDAQYLLVKIV